MRYNEDGLFPVLEAALKQATEPLDCQALYEMPSVRARAASVNRVSDYLGNLWRKGLVTRIPAPKTDTTRARWMYEWKAPKKATMRGMVVGNKVLSDKAHMVISEDGGSITIDFDRLQITIRQRPE